MDARQRGPEGVAGLAPGKTPGRSPRSSTKSPGAILDARQRGPEGVAGRDARHNLSRRAIYIKGLRVNVSLFYFPGNKWGNKQPKIR